MKSLREVKSSYQAILENNDKALEIFGKTYSPQIKGYLIEANYESPLRVICPSGTWKSLDHSNWFINEGGDYSNFLCIDATRERIWIIYSIIEATMSDLIIDNWVKNNRGVDRCWLSRHLLLLWNNNNNWLQRGLGLRFNDGLTPEEDAGNFSLKAWYGVNKYVQGMEELLSQAKEKFAIYSTRWQKRECGSVSISSEWYSNGKVTINRGNDIDEVFLHVSQMANKYEDELKHATKLRDDSLGAFEISFSQKIDLNSFSDIVSKGLGDMKLWLVETDSEDDFRRYKGVDLHTWDRVNIDLGLHYAYLTIPGKGCINAAPRLAVIQGEDIAGKTSIFHDGVEIFV